MQYYRSALVHCHLSFQASWLDQVFFLEVGGGPSDNFVCAGKGRGNCLFVFILRGVVLFSCRKLQYKQAVTLNIVECERVSIYLTCFRKMK